MSARVGRETDLFIASRHEVIAEVGLQLARVTAICS